MKTIDPEKFVKLGEIISLLRDDYYMPKRDAAKYCGVSVRTLESWTGLPKYRPSGMTLFRKSELDHFMESHRELPTTVDLAKLADEAVAAGMRGKSASPAKTFIELVKKSNQTNGQKSKRNRLTFRIDLPAWPGGRM